LNMTMRKYVTIFAALFIMGLMMPDEILAQSGRIVGKVVEKGTGEPMIGATVGIQGTTRGAIVDLDGRYQLLNVAPGTYTLEARLIGFATAIVQEVIVRTDLTTTQDFELQEEIVEGEEIIIVAERPVIIRDLTSSEARVSKEDIDRLPVQELTDIIRLQAGVNVSNSGQIHIRGGRASEVSYVVDGIRVTDDYDRSQGLRIENESIQELQVISGTFNAEHGQAMSGIINVVTRAGGNNLTANFSSWVGSYLVSRPDFYDGLSSNFQNLDPTRMYNVSGSVSGPIIRNKLTFFVTGRTFRNEGWLTGRNAFSAQGPYEELLDLGTDLSTYRTRYNDLVDLSRPWFTADTLTQQGVEYLRIMDSGVRDSSLVNMNVFETYSVQGNLQFRPNNYLRFNLIGSYATEEGGGYSHSRKLVPTGLSSFTRENYSLNLRTTITPSSNTFITVNTATTRNSFESNLYSDPFDARFFNYENLETIPVRQPGQAFQFDRVGTDNGLFNRSTETYIVKAEVSSQLNDRHFIKAGVNLQMDVVNFENINLQPLNPGQGITLPSDFPEDRERFVELGIPPLETTNHSRYTRKPYNLSAYIQDKLEYSDMIVNIGLRFDYFKPNALIPRDSQDPDITNPILEENRQLTRQEREQIWWKEAEAKYQFSPRLGIAYPISDKGVIYFSYGYFFQMPSYEFLFTNSQILLPESSGVFGIFGNPDLKPERSTQYELGLKYEIFTGTALEVTGFYKDTRDYVSSGIIERTYIPSVRYATWINRDYSYSKGLTVAVNQFISQRINVGLDYTYTTVEGSNSDPAAEFNLAVASGDLSSQSLTKFVRPLDWDRTHILNGTVFFNEKTWGANLVGRLLTGTPYTPSTPFRIRTGPTASVRDLFNTGRHPNRFTVDLNTYKNISIAGNQLRLFLNVYNLLDSKVVNSIFSDSGTPDGPLIQPSVFDDGYFNDPSRFDEPRRIQFGIQLSL